MDSVSLETDCRAGTRRVHVRHAHKGSYDVRVVVLVHPRQTLALGYVATTRSLQIVPF